MKSPEGKALIEKMVKKVDVVIENMAPGTFARLGFDYERLKELNPRIIFAQVRVSRQKDLTEITCPST